LINANQVAGVAGKLVLARPDLEPRITKLLLTFQNPHLDAIHNDLVKSYAIASFQEYLTKLKTPPHPGICREIASQSQSAGKEGS